MEGFRGGARGTVCREFGGYEIEVEKIIGEREWQALRNKVKDEKQLEIYEGLGEDSGMKRICTA